MRVYLLVMLIAAAVTYLMVPVVRRIALASGAITQVRDRDVHTVPIPRLGGLAMLIGLAVSFAVASQIPYLSQEFAGGSVAWGILVGAALMCLIGIIDDIWELDWYAKLAGEILAAGIMAWQGIQFVSVPVWGLTVGSTRLTLFLTIIVVVIVANAINFIDGLDGLAAGVVGIGSFAFFVYTYMLTRESSPGDYSSIAVVVVAALVGICIGFLPHNFNPATIFMGDSGALMLGLVCAAAGIVVTGQIDPSIATTRTIPAFMPIILPIGVLLIPLLDFAYAVLRRLLKGQSPFTADSGHLHHRLLRAGNSHRGAVQVIYAWSALFSFIAVALAFFDPLPVSIAGAVGLLLVVAYTRWEMRGKTEAAPEHTTNLAVAATGGAEAAAAGHDRAGDHANPDSTATTAVVNANRASTAETRSSTVAALQPAGAGAHDSTSFSRAEDEGLDSSDTGEREPISSGTHAASEKDEELTELHSMEWLETELPEGETLGDMPGVGCEQTDGIWPGKLHDDDRGERA